MKHIIPFLLFLLLLSGCKSKEITVYQDADISKFDEILMNIGNGNTKAYDLRSMEDCREGRIPGFFCMRTINSNNEVRSLERIHSDLKSLLGNDYDYLIILMDYDGQEAAKLASLLFADGYYNIHYFESGYQEYVDLKGDLFVPETGDCTTC
mgnify:CR=1 FL=1|jgi:hypothetical protein